MFFKQIRRNAAHNRRGNGLYFGSLIIAIVAFYTLLSLKEQDVMQFLSTIESDAVRKLMMLIPGVYAVSLFFVFFLVYFACRYQMDSRRREFGMYLMLGMKRSRLFLMLLGETLWSSMISLLIGLPIALLLTEGTSLATGKVIGLGIIGHTISLSFDAILWTVCGFLIVQLLSMLIICIPYGKTEPAKFMYTDASSKQAPASSDASIIFLFLGIAFLLLAYYIGLFRLMNQDLLKMTAYFTAMLISGIGGTFFLYRGVGGYIGRHIAKKNHRSNGLSTFTGRQVQESVLSQHKALAVSSLLLLVALSCISYGIAMGAGRISDSRTTDFSVIGTEKEVSSALTEASVRDMVETSYPVYLSRTKTEFDTRQIQSELAQIEGAENVAESFHSDYILSVSSYNSLLSAMGKKGIKLADNEVALYSTLDDGSLYSYYREALKKGLTIGINEKQFKLLSEFYSDNIVADRSITLYAALIVPDSLFGQLASNTEPFCWNLHLKKSLTDELGLMQAIQKMDTSLNKTGLEYESYLSGIGRNLFYAVAASYLTIYLGILFLLIANTVVGTKYLIQQRENKHRYVTLLMLGANTEGMCRSAKKQINMFFALVLGVAVCSSIVGVFVLFRNFTRLPIGTELTTVIVLSMIALLAFILTEFVYISVVKRNACREIREIEITDRG